MDNSVTWRFAHSPNREQDSPFFSEFISPNFSLILLMHSVAIQLIFESG